MLFLGGWGGKEAFASYLLGLMLLICLFILSLRLHVISPGSPRRAVLNEV